VVGTPIAMTKGVPPPISLIALVKLLKKSVLSADAGRQKKIGRKKGVIYREIFILRPICWAVGPFLICLKPNNPIKMHLHVCFLQLLHW